MSAQEHPIEMSLTTDMMNKAANYPDPIGTITALQAEVERLKAENARLTTELDAWQRTCGTRQNHIEDVEKLKAENARLYASYAEMTEACRQICSPFHTVQRLENLEIKNETLENEVERLKAELSQAKAEIQAWERGEVDMVSPIAADRDRLKAENARLAAVCALAYEKLGWIREYVEFKDSMNVAIIELGKVAESTALNDLLAPTIELLEKIHQTAYSGAFWTDGKALTNEIARLRSLAGESAPKKSSCAPAPPVVNRP